MRLRPARPADARGLYALENRLFGEEDYPLSLRALRYHIGRNLLLVAETAGGETAGYILALVRRKSPKLYSLGVAPEHRREGVGFLLIRGMLDALHASGFTRCVLEVRSDNATAIALYKRFGFVATKRLEGFYRDGCDALWMERYDA